MRGLPSATDRIPLVLLALLSALGCVAAPKSYESERTLPVRAVDYSAWDALLRAHVRDGAVDYPAFAAAPEFEAFLETIRRVRIEPSATQEEKLAFYMNAYNARAIDGILRGGSPATLLGRHRFFQRERFAVAGEEITLWDLEHQRIRPFGEPRIHFAIVCASASCPPLASEALVPEKLDVQLERLTRAFVNDPAKNAFDPAAKAARLSAIFDWYEEDFPPSVARYVAAYVDVPETARGLAGSTWKIRYQDYDWSLNGTPPGPR